MAGAKKIKALVLDEAFAKRIKGRKKLLAHLAKGVEYEVRRSL
jgi:hypothetical protein